MKSTQNRTGTWKTHADLLNTDSLCCIDGRRNTPAFGTPGGSLAECVVVLHALESLTQPSNATAIQAFVEHMNAQGLALYHHGDTGQVTRLQSALRTRGLPTWEAPQDAQSWLTAPPAEVRETLSELLTQPEFVGCGHLNGMLVASGDYGVRPELVQDVIRSFFRLLWQGHPRCEYEVLQGSHEEQSVLIVSSAPDANGNQGCWSVTPNTDLSHFVYHADAAHFVREKMVQWAHANRQVADLKPESISEAAQSAAQQHLVVTVERLAPTLEHIAFQPE